MSSSVVALPRRSPPRQTGPGARCQASIHGALPQRHQLLLLHLLLDLLHEARLDCESL